MNGKEQLNEFESKTFTDAGWFGRAVKRRDWAKASAIAGGIVAGLSTLADAAEVDEYKSLNDEIVRATLVAQDIMTQVANEAVTASINAYAEFLLFLPEAHERLATIMELEKDPGTRGGDKKVLLELAASRAMNVLGLA